MLLFTISNAHCHMVIVNGAHLKWAFISQFSSSKIYTYSALHINLISIKITCPMILFINSDYVVGGEKKNFYPNFLLSMVGALVHLGKYTNKFCGNRFHNECAVYKYSLQAIGETTTNQPFWMIQIGSLVIALDHTALLFS